MNPVGSVQSLGQERLRLTIWIKLADREQWSECCGIDFSFLFSWLDVYQDEPTRWKEIRLPFRNVRHAKRFSKTIPNILMCKEFYAYKVSCSRLLSELKEKTQQVVEVRGLGKKKEIPIQPVCKSSSSITPPTVLAWRHNQLFLYIQTPSNWTF